MATLIREALRSVDPDLPLLQPQMLTTRIAQTVADRRLALVLLASFAGLALLLASLGVYSVMAHLVAFRTSEIGIRMALGATPGSVMRMVLGHSSPPHTHRHRAWRRGRVRGVAADGAGAVRSRSSESALLYRGLGDAAAGRRLRVVVPGATGDADRSGDRATNGLRGGKDPSPEIRDRSLNASAVSSSSGSSPPSVLRRRQRPSRHPWRCVLSGRDQIATTVLSFCDNYCGTADGDRTSPRGRRRCRNAERFV